MINIIVFYKYFFWEKWVFCFYYDRNLEVFILRGETKDLKSLRIIGWGYGVFWIVRRFEDLL